MAESMNENIIEFLRNSNTATVSFCQGKYVTKIKKLAERFPNECQIVAENNDGSIVAHIPTKWIKINNPRREMTEEERRLASERFKNNARSREKKT